MHFNTLYHGMPAAAADELDSTNRPAEEIELRAALTNALRRIDGLERDVRELRTLVTLTAQN